MVGGRRRPAPRVAEDGGPVRPGVKGKNFCREEEEQLCRTVLHITQDRIVGNQQRAGVFWERISEHYDLNKPGGSRPTRSLETKWGTIKHDVSKFIGMYAQVVKLNKSGTSKEDTLRKAHELYKIKSAKGTDFCFEHCWILVKDHPKWADGWTQSKPPTPKRRAPVSEELEDSGGRAEMAEEGGAVSEGPSVVLEPARVFKGRPGGTKAAKEDHKVAKARDGAIYKQAEATMTMAQAQMHKSRLLEDQNMLLLFSMPEEQITSAEGREYLHLRRNEELRRLRRRAIEDEERLLELEAERGRARARVAAEEKRAADELAKAAAQRSDDLDSSDAVQDNHGQDGEDDEDVDVEEEQLGDGIEADDFEGEGGQWGGNGDHDLHVRRGSRQAEFGGDGEQFREGSGGRNAPARGGNGAGGRPSVGGRVVGGGWVVGGGNGAGEGPFGQNSENQVGAENFFRTGSFASNDDLQFSQATGFRSPPPSAGFEQLMRAGNRQMNFARQGILNSSRGRDLDFGGGLEAGDGGNGSSSRLGNAGALHAVREGASWQNLEHVDADQPTQ